MTDLVINVTNIGPQNWKNSTLNNINVTQRLIKSSDRSNFLGRSYDPLPNLRDVLAELSNCDALNHARDVRIVTIKLQDSYISTNEEIKRLIKAKEMNEKSLENIRKDICLCYETQEIRSSRPAREKDQDGADDLLQAELMHLKHHKKELEVNLGQIKNQLLQLDGARFQLEKVIKERSRVLDLFNISSGSANFTKNNASNSLKSYLQRDCVSSRPHVNSTDPLGAFTPECDISLKNAESERNKSQVLCKQTNSLVDRIQRLQLSAKQSVNNGLTQKIAETVVLKQQLQLSSASARTAVNKAERWMNATQLAGGYLQGPVSSSDLLTRERLIRPLIRINQRHPGNQNPEARELIKGRDALFDSLVATSKNIGLLQVGNLKLQQDLIDKNCALRIDSAALRNRRQKFDHRWTLGAPF